MRDVQRNEARDAPDGLHLRIALARQTFDVDVDLTLPGSGVSVLFGPSGSGKTTLLRCVAGLEGTARGLVRIGSTVWQDDSTGVYLPPWRRDLGYVFQESSLFAHLNVRRNLEFGMRRARRAGGAQALHAAIELLGIEHLLPRSVTALSGGERQRVAIARALAMQPSLLLLDEPLSALDRPRRLDVLPWLERLRDELGTPMLYVTHSPAEVARLANHLVVMDKGRVTACGPVSEVLASMDHRTVVGDDAGAVLNAQIVERDEAWSLLRAQVGASSFWITDAGQRVNTRVRLRVLARDVSIQLQAPTQTSIANHVRAVVDSVAIEADPSQALVRLRIEKSEDPCWLLARLTRRSVAMLELAPGRRVWALVKAVAVSGH